MAQKIRPKLWRVNLLDPLDRPSTVIVSAKSDCEAADAIFEMGIELDIVAIDVATVGDLGASRVMIEACALARNMAYAWARRHGLGGECAERILDMSIPSVVRLAQSELGGLSDAPASEVIYGLAFYSHDNARRVRGEDFMAEKEAMLCWASGVNSGLHQSATRGLVVPNPSDDEKRVARRKVLEYLHNPAFADLS